MQNLRCNNIAPLEEFELIDVEAELQLPDDMEIPYVPDIKEEIEV